MKNLILLVVLILFIGCQSQNKEKNASQENSPFEQLLNDYYQDGLKLNPLTATFNGDNRYNHLLPIEISTRHIKNQMNYFQKYLDLLKTIDKSSLNAEEKLSYDILKYECEINGEGLKFPNALQPINQFWSTPLTISQLAGGSGAQPFETVKDYQNWLERLKLFSFWSNQAIANMKSGIEKGIVLPKPLTEKVIPQIAALIEGPVEEHLYYKPIINMPEKISKEEKAQIAQDYKNMLEDKIIPSFKVLQEFLSTEYLEASREEHGLTSLPGGESWYQYLIKYWTTTDLTAEQIHNLGLSEVARIRKEMTAVKDVIGFDGSLNEFFDHVRTNKDLMPYQNAEEVIQHFNAINNKLKPSVSSMFDLKPKTPFEIRRTEAFREASASAEYNAGTPDGSRPGIFYVPVPDASKYNNFSDEALFLHEAIPGHHYQISLTQESTTLPEFRKFLWYGAYGEGWALYCESLGKELGLYTDPYQYFGMLSMEIHRAIRLVVDTGIHAMGWTREEAIAYSLENEAEPEESVIAEIERYMAIPGQALSYKIGQLKIQELRDRAERDLGDKFEIAKFHNEILDAGCVPLTVLNDKIINWISQINNS